MELKYVSFSTKRPFGVEIEVNRKVPQAKIAEIIASVDGRRHVDVTGWGNSICNNNWHVKTDSTCGDTGKRSDGGGFEICSFVASGYSNLKTITKVVKNLGESGVQVNKYCGIHIHAQIKDYDMNHAAKLAAIWAKMEPIFMEAVPPRRRNGKYCKSLRYLYYKGKKSEFSIANFWKKVKPRGYSAADKRTSLNFTNFLRNRIHDQGRVTVEFRLPEGTLDHTDVKNWVRLFIHFVSKARKLPSPSDIKPANVKEAIEYLGLRNESPFFILSPGLFETKLWFLNRILRFSNDNEIRKEVDSILGEMIEPGIHHSSLERILGKEVYHHYMYEKLNKV